MSNRRAPVAAPRRRSLRRSTMRVATAAVAAAALVWSALFAGLVARHDATVARRASPAPDGAAAPSATPRPAPSPLAPVTTRAS